MKPFICNFWCIALYPKHLEEDSNSFITNARTSLIELFGILLDKPIFLKIILNGRIDKLKMKFSIKGTLMQIWKSPYMFVFIQK